MRHILPLAALALAACGSAGKDDIADKVEARADNQAEAIDDRAAATGNAVQANSIEQQADTVRQAGEERAEAIRESDLDARKMTPEDKAKLVKGE